MNIITRPDRQIKMMGTENTEHEGEAPMIEFNRTQYHTAIGLTMTFGVTSYQRVNISIYLFSVI